ncbi:MAG: flagellar motor protein MotB, partial [Plesiomonas shigelloides]
MDEPRKIPRRTGGAPAYMTTFADLMTLLLCFFVLLLSFSEMDVEKYKQIA